MDVAAAQRLAREHLHNARPRRWQHTRQVADTAAKLVEALELDPDVVVSAAWLHDLGYAPTVTASGFHPLDGARFLQREGWSDTVTGLVAHHSCADVEAERRGYGEALVFFPDQAGAERDALWMADATTGPEGQTLTVGERVLEVVDRYGYTDLVSECMVAIALPLVLATQRTGQRLAGRTPSEDVVRTTGEVLLLPGVLNILTKWDPEGLMGFEDMPPDEYDLEAMTFSALLRAGYEIDASTVIAVWEGWFGPSSIMTRERGSDWIAGLAAQLNAVPVPKDGAQPM